MKNIFLFFCFLSAYFSFAQDSTAVKKDSILFKKDTSYWKYNSTFGVNGSQTSFVNWAAGGRNNISALAFVNFSLKYQQKKIKWMNDVKLALGGLKFIDSTGMKQGMQKTDDKIDLATTFGYEFKKNWFYTVVGGFKTQSLNGFNFPNDSVIVSKFMAPGYLNFALGIEYSLKKSVLVFISPLAAKFTFVKDETLANAGAFGVRKAEFDNLGNLIKKGETSRKEMGSYFKFNYNKEILEHVELKSRLELFSSYLNNPQNIDVNAEVIFVFKINKWLMSSLQWNVIYDDDIHIRDTSGKTGPRTQFKSLLGLGISYQLKN